MGYVEYKVSLNFEEIQANTGQYRLIQINTNKKSKIFFTKIVDFLDKIAYTNINRTSHASLQCVPREVI